MANTPHGTTPDVREEARVASNSIRGFLCQILLSAIRWTNIGPGEVIVIEGNEDIERHLFRDGRLIQASEESVKALAGT